MVLNILQPKSAAPTEGCLLLLQVPRTNEKKALAAEQMLASLHGLLTLPATSAFSEATRERISFEIAVLNKRIGFYVWIPKYLKDYVAEQIYAQYPSVQISEIEDYTTNDKQYGTVLSMDMQMDASDVLPIKMFQSFDVDPLAAITATLAKFEDDEEAWVQLILRPASSQWQKKSEQYLRGIRSGKTKTTGMLQALWAPPETTTTAKQLTEYEQTRASGAEAKSQKLAFEAVLRVVYRSNGNDTQARLRMQSIIASYKQFNTTYLNGFKQGRINTSPILPEVFEQRAFARDRYTLNIEEVATLYHLPHTNVETPFILWASSQTAEPPANLPIANEPRTDISPVAMTHFRGHDTPFGLPRSDRGRHLYIIGQTGVGKSGLLELLTISDVYSEYGFAVIDPHGDYAQNTLKRVPKERANDVIYFNAADTEFPIAFNPMEVYDPKLKNHTCSELIGVLKRMFESWGPRLEYILRYSILALLDYPDATMLDITRILTDKAFRKRVLSHVQDPVVLNFWNVEFASWNDKFAAEAVAPVLNKVGAFTANPLVRNIIGQPKSSFNIREIMDGRKILIINLSRGLVGEDNASLLGALIVTKIQMAAMSRADLPVDQRVPFYLYVDEFQNFATDSFATILSEARKYGLNLTVANQYTAQMLPQVKDAVFGNVGSIIAFRMSADDARVMQRYFEPHFVENDLVHMHNRHFVISMAIEGEKAQAFSAISLNLPPLGEDYIDYIVELSRKNYAKPLLEVQQTVNEQYNTAPTELKIPAAKSKAKKQPAKEKEPAKIVVQPAVPATKPASRAANPAAFLQNLSRIALPALFKQATSAEQTVVAAQQATKPAKQAESAKPKATPIAQEQRSVTSAAATPIKKEPARRQPPVATGEPQPLPAQESGEVMVFSRHHDTMAEPQPLTLTQEAAPMPPAVTAPDTNSAAVSGEEAEAGESAAPKKRRRRRRRSKAKPAEPASTELPSA